MTSLTFPLEDKSARAWDRRRQVYGLTQPTGVSDTTPNQAKESAMAGEFRAYQQLCESRSWFALLVAHLLLRHSDAVTS